jgi:transposase-like protein
VQYLNNILEQDHRAIKRRVRASQHFRSFWGAWRTIAGSHLPLLNSQQTSSSDESGSP